MHLSKSQKRRAEVELKTRDYTDIAKSSKSFEVTDWRAIGPSDETLTIELKNLKDLPAFQKVTLLAAKVVQVDEGTFLDDGRKYQNIIVADSTSSTIAKIFSLIMQ